MPASRLWGTVLSEILAAHDVPSVPCSAVAPHRTIAADDPPSSWELDVDECMSAGSGVWRVRRCPKLAKVMGLTGARLRRLAGVALVAHLPHLELRRVHRAIADLECAWCGEGFVDGGECGRCRLEYLAAVAVRDLEHITRMAVQTTDTLWSPTWRERRSWEEMHSLNTRLYMKRGQP